MSENAQSIYLQVLHPLPHPIICDDLYDCLISFGQINKIVKLSSTRTDLPQMLVEFNSMDEANACIEHLKTNPLPRFNVSARAELSITTRLTVKGESLYSRNYLLNPRSSSASAGISTLNRVLLVSDLPSSLSANTVTHIYNLFSLYGSPRKINVLKDRKMAMIEYETGRDAGNAYDSLNSVPFFHTSIFVKQSRHDSIAAPPSEFCKTYALKMPTFEPKHPTVFVRFKGLHPIVGCSPNKPMALCHYFDHYAVPRPVDVFFENEQSGVFAFRDIKDSICAICILNHLNENGFVLELGFVEEPPVIPQENLQFYYGQPQMAQPMPPQQMYGNQGYQMNQPPQQQQRYGYGNQQMNGYQQNQQRQFDSYGNRPSNGNTRDYHYAPY